MVETFPTITYFLVVLFIVRVSRSKNSTKSISKSKSWTSLLSSKLQSLEIFNKLYDDPESLKIASRDFGNILSQIPAAVFYPSSINDIMSLIKISYNSSVPFTIAARGCGHSIRGQSMAHNGIVVDMKSMKKYKGLSKGSGIMMISCGSSNSSVEDHQFYYDVGGEELWIDVLHATLDYGLSPVSWTDYLYLTVGGTLSNAGISGQTFRYGPQINNVQEMDVVTGRGDFVTCSAERNSELFHAVLGGLGQFGIIVRARISLQSAPKRVKWLRMLYHSFSEFVADQERLISINGNKQSEALNYLEGLLLIHHGPPDNWRSSFFPPSDHSLIISLVNQHTIIYCLEIAKYYDDHTQNTVQKELQVLIEGLNFTPGFVFEKDVTYTDFLNRVRSGELKLQSQGLWDVPHPWMNLFVPKSQISDFNSGVFKDILLKRKISNGTVLVYPMNRNKWDDMMTAVTPNEDVFYTVGFLYSSGFGDWQAYEDQNKDIIEFCESSDIEIKQYLPHYETQADWQKHFGSKWKSIRERKLQFDPKLLLSPGQRIFN